MKRNSLTKFLSLLLLTGLISADAVCGQSDQATSPPAPARQADKAGKSDETAEANAPKPASEDTPVLESYEDAPRPSPVWRSAQSASVSTSASAGKTAEADAAGLASEINKRLPGWLSIGGEFRLRYEGKTGRGGLAGNDDSYALSRFRLNLTIKPTDQLTFFIQGQDSQAFGFNFKPDPSSLENTFDLRQAWVDWKLGGAMAGWAVRVGRQEFKYGDERVIGASDWGNTARAFDAIRLGVTGRHYALDLFASSVVIAEEGVFDKRRAGENLYGAHATFPTAIPDAELNVYAYWRTTPLVFGEGFRLGDSDIVTFGARARGDLPGDFDYTVEAMLQRGEFATDEVSAYAFHGRLSRRLARRHWSPALLVEYNQASGDEDPLDGRRGTYDQLFPTNHGKYGIHDVVGFRNLQNLRFGVSFQPGKKVKLEGDYHSFWLTEERDGLYGEQGGLFARNASGAAGKHIAQELDFQFSYSPKEFISFGTGYAHWIPGEFWKAQTFGAPGSSAYTFVTYKF